MFKFKTYLPARDEWLFSRQMTSKEYLVIVKTMQNNDSVQIRDALLALLESCFEISDIETYNQIDIFCMLVNLRIMSVSQKLALLYNPNNEQSGKNVHVDLYDILDKASNTKTTYNKKITTGEIEVTVTTPQGLVYDLPEISYVQYIKSLRHVPTDTNYIFEKMTPIERAELIKNLPVKLMQRLINMLSHNKNAFDVQIIGDLGDEKNDIRLSLYDNSMFNTLRLCYNANLSDLYNLRYILTKRCNIDINYLEDLPPIEMDTYFGILKKEIDDERKAMEKHSGKTRDVSLPVQNFVQ